MSRGVSSVKRRYKPGDAVGEAWSSHGDNSIHELSARLGIASEALLDSSRCLPLGLRNLACHLNVSGLGKRRATAGSQVISVPFGSPFLKQKYIKAGGWWEDAASISTEEGVVRSLSASEIVAHGSFFINKRNPSTWL